MVPNLEPHSEGEISYNVCPNWPTCKEPLRIHRSGDGLSKWQVSILKV